MIYLDAAVKKVHLERWTERCSPMSENGMYPLKPGVTEGFINCRLRNEDFARVRSFRMAGTLPNSAYKHQLESNTVRLDKK
jgi:hypothetical protein